MKIMALTSKQRVPVTFFALCYVASFFVSAFPSIQKSNAAPEDASKQSNRYASFDLSASKTQDLKFLLKKKAKINSMNCDEIEEKKKSEIALCYRTLEKRELLLSPAYTFSTTGLNDVILLYKPENEKTPIDYISITADPTNKDEIFRKVKTIHTVLGKNGVLYQVFGYYNNTSHLVLKNLTDGKLETGKNVVIYFNRKPLFTVQKSNSNVFTYNFTATALSQNSVTVGDFDLKVSLHKTIISKLAELFDLYSNLGKLVSFEKFIKNTGFKDGVKLSCGPAFFSDFKKTLISVEEKIQNLITHTLAVDDDSLVNVKHLKNEIKLEIKQLKEIKRKLLNGKAIWRKEPTTNLQPIFNIIKNDLPYVVKKLAKNNHDFLSRTACFKGPVLTLDYLKATEQKFTKILPYSTVGTLSVPFECESNFSTQVEALEKFKTLLYSHMSECVPNQENLWFTMFQFQKRSFEITEQVLGFLRSSHIYMPESKKERLDSIEPKRNLTKNLELIQLRINNIKNLKDQPKQLTWQLIKGDKRIRKHMKGNLEFTSLARSIVLQKSEDLVIKKNFAQTMGSNFDDAKYDDYMARLKTKQAELKIHTRNDEEALTNILNILEEPLEIIISQAVSTAVPDNVKHKENIQEAVPDDSSVVPAVQETQSVAFIETEVITDSSLQDVAEKFVSPTPDQTELDRQKRHENENVLIQPSEQIEGVANDDVKEIEYENQDIKDLSENNSVIETESNSQESSATEDAETQDAAHEDDNKSEKGENIFSQNNNSGTDSNSGAQEDFSASKFFKSVEPAFVIAICLVMIVFGALVMLFGGSPNIKIQAFIGLFFGYGFSASLMLLIKHDINFFIVLPVSICVGGGLCFVYLKASPRLSLLTVNFMNGALLFAALMSTKDNLLLSGAVARVSLFFISAVIGLLVAVFKDRPLRSISSTLLGLTVIYYAIDYLSDGPISSAYIQTLNTSSEMHYTYSSYIFYFIFVFISAPLITKIQRTILKKRQMKFSKVPQAVGVGHEEDLESRPNESFYLTDERFNRT